MYSDRTFFYLKKIVNRVLRNGKLEKIYIVIDAIVNALCMREILSMCFNITRPGVQ